MWTVLKKQCSAVWYVAGTESGRVILEEIDRVLAVESTVLRQLSMGGPVGSVEVHALDSETVVVAVHEEGAVGVVASRKGNTMAIEAALKRWPGAAMMREAVKGFGRDEATARVSASAALIEGTRPDRSAGLEESTNPAEYGELSMEDSFAEEAVLSGRADVAPEPTRIMACTWIQVVEHFGRIAEILEEHLEVDVVGHFAVISSSLGGYLRVVEGEFSTSSPSKRVGSADAEAVDGVYRAWIRALQDSSDIDVANRVPSVDATPWRGLLAERDAPIEPISFSI